MMDHITVVIFRRHESAPYESRVLQHHTLGPNLSPKAPNPLIARQSAERRIRQEGFHGEIRIEEGLPEPPVRTPAYDEGVPGRRGLKRARRSSCADLFGGPVS